MSVQTRALTFVMRKPVRSFKAELLGDRCEASHGDVTEQLRALIELDAVQPGDCWHESLLVMWNGAQVPHLLPHLLRLHLLPHRVASKLHAEKFPELLVVRCR